MAALKKIDGGEAMIAYLQEHRSLLAGRPQCFQHGDYHVGNLMLENGRLVVIDFNRFDFGDPWEEFNRIVWCAQASPRFSPPLWSIRLFRRRTAPALLEATGAVYREQHLSSLPWAVLFGQAEIDTMRNQARDVLSWYDRMTRVVPRWYRHTGDKT